MSEPAFTLARGARPLLISCPHDGIFVPPQISARMAPQARNLPDTDWHVARLYDFAGELGASVLTATHSRYVVDLNRDPAGTELYPGADNTGIVPITAFSGEEIYLPDQRPDAGEVAERIERYFLPYHQALAAELERLRGQFGVAVLLDAHSIRSQVPRFFSGTLPDLNLGSADGQSASVDLCGRVFGVLSATDYSAVHNGRFKGGYITRHYGAPERGVHALQLELSQYNYMSEAPPFAYDAPRARTLRVVLCAALLEILAFAEAAR